jgi:hypothetical protein
MAVRKVETFPPVTMGHIRGHGCRDLLVYCGSGRCHVTLAVSAMSGDGKRSVAAWPKLPRPSSTLPSRAFAAVQQVVLRTRIARAGFVSPT